MKTFFAILATAFISIPAFASEIPEAELQPYKDAVRIALSKAQLVCTFSPPYTNWSDGSTGSAGINEMVQQSKTAVLNERGAQPVITFKLNYASMELSTAITTTADYRNIVSIYFTQHERKTERVNLGTIVQPDIVDQQVTTLQATVTCK